MTFLTVPNDDFILNVDHGEAFSLTSSSSNFTISNIIFDTSEHTVGNVFMQMGSRLLKLYFYPFYGDANLGIFENCSFIGFNNMNSITGPAGRLITFNSKFINCYIESDNEVHKLFEGDLKNTIHIFDNCILNMPNVNYLATIRLPCNISMDNCWFGKNSLPGYIGPFSGGTVINPNGTYNTTYVISVVGAEILYTMWLW